MNRFRERMLADQEKSDAALFEKIKDNPHPDILDLWSLSEDRFIAWRKLHDFPILLKHFDKVLPLFNEWKLANNLTNEIIIKSGYLTPFLEKKRHAKKQGEHKSLFLIKQYWKDSETITVNYTKLEGEKEYLGTKYKFEFIQEFKSYLDWLSTQGKAANILYINSRISPQKGNERVFIHADIYATKTDFELLKMGGIPIPVERFGILNRGKKLEFVNLCGLKLNGRISFGERGNLSCSYCACDNWEAEALDMPMLTLDHCSVSNFTLISSKLLQWRFYDCFVSGDFFNSKLYGSIIDSGSFAPVIQDCTLSTTDIVDDPNLIANNLIGYKTFKKIYQSQGDDEIAKIFFIKENEFIRKKLKGWEYITKTISFLYWEYGHKPHRIIYLSLAIIFLFGCIFWLSGDLVAYSNKTKSFGFWDGVYFSTITFTTLGYGDYSPTGWLKILCSIEAFSGVVNMGFLIAGYSNNKY
jgi:hypothetical protein